MDTTRVLATAQTLCLDTLDAPVLCSDPSATFGQDGHYLRVAAGAVRCNTMGAVVGLDFAFKFLPDPCDQRRS